MAKGLPVVDVRLAVAALKAGDDPLTDRECEVLRRVTTGATAQEIAHAQPERGHGAQLPVAHSRQDRARSHIEAIRKAQDASWI